MASLASEVVRPAADWQRALAEALRSPGELCRLLGLEASMAASAEQASGSFPLLVPHTWLGRIRAGDPEDPLLVQVLPRAAECVEAAGFVPDPLDEAGSACGGSLLRKYRGRCVIVASRRCAVHCRFCFRRHFHGWPAKTPTESGVLKLHGIRANGDLRGTDGIEKHGEKAFDAAWEPAVRRVAADDSIREVILSGGDPLVLGDDELAMMAERIAAIGHVRRLRIHTRLPVVIPQRVTDRLLGWLSGTRLTPVVVIHVNHPAEIDEWVAEALGRLVDAGMPVLSQSVLLRGVNDRAAVLQELCERLADLRVVPYYLHQLDRVAGAAHFEVPEETGVELIGRLRAQLPGYAVPRYVREVPGEENKRVLA